MTVYENSRDFSCTAEANVFGKSEDYEFSFVIFGQINEENQSSSQYAYYETKYPPFFDNGNVYVYVDGTDSLRETIHWHCYNNDPEPGSGMIPVGHAFLEVQYTLHDSSYGTGTDFTIRECPPDDTYPYGITVGATDGQLVLTGHPSFNAVPYFNFGGVAYTKKTSGSAVAKSMNYRTVYAVYDNETPPPDYYDSAKRIDADYRVFSGMTFNSLSEWLAWCKAH